MLTESRLESVIDSGRVRSADQHAELLSISPARLLDIEEGAAQQAVATCHAQVRTAGKFQLSLTGEKSSLQKLSKCGRLWAFGAGPRKGTRLFRMNEA